MILETKQAKGKGGQIIQGLTFDDSVIISNKVNTFKLQLDNDGLNVYSQQNCQWTRVNRYNNEQTQTTLQDLTKKTDVLVNKYEELKQLLLMKQQISDLQLQLKTLQAQIDQDRMVSVPQVEINNPVKLIEVVKQQDQFEDTVQQQTQAAELPDQLPISEDVVKVVESDQQTISIDKSSQLQQEIQTNIESYPQNYMKNGDQVGSEYSQFSLPTLKNKSFVVNQQVQGQDYITLKCKDSVQMDPNMQSLSCRHIKQFFDLQVVGVNTQSKEIRVKPDPKLKNKQTVFVLDTK